jgi:DNA-binding CsgD family transcriptional regulator
MPTGQNAFMPLDLPLVARQLELSTVIEVIESAVDRRGQGVIITGEAGIGKTRLLREARAAAERLALPVLAGRAIESCGAYRPLVDAFARSAAPFASHPDLVAVRPALARVLPGWVSETTVLAPMADPDAVLATALILLLQVMAPDGAVLIIDDLQWADPDTLSVLTSLVDSIDTMPLALIAAARGETRTDAVFHQLRTGHSIRDLPLSRLTPTQVADALQANEVRRLPAQQLEQLVTVIDGLPLIMDEFIRQIHERGSEVDLLGLTSSTLSSAVQLRLVGLSVECRVVLDALSVIGDTDAEVLVAATGLDSERVGPALHAGLASTLLVPTSNSLGVGWRHILIGEVVSDLLLPLERQAIAVRAAGRLSDGSAPNDGQLRQAARLFELAGDRHQAAEQLLRAARLTLTHGALDAALQDLSDARRLTGGIPESAHEVLIEYIETLCVAGRAGDAYDSGMAALSGTGRRDRRLLAATVRAAYVGRLDQEGRELLARLERETDTDDAQLAVLRAEGAFVDHLPGAVKLAHEAALRAQQEGRIDLACQALMAAGWRATWIDIEQGGNAFRQALELSRQHALTHWEVRANWGLGAIDMITASDPTRLGQTRKLATTAGMVGIVAAINLHIALIDLLRSGYVAAYPSIVRANTQARQLRVRDIYSDSYARLVDCYLLAEQPLPDLTGPPSAHDIEAAIAHAMELEKDYRDLFGVKSALGARAWLHGESATAIGLIEEDTQQVESEIKLMPWWGFACLLRVVGGDDPLVAFDRVDRSGHHTNWAARAFGLAVGQLRHGQPADAALAEAERYLRSTPFWGHVLRTVIAPVVVEAGMRSTAEGWLREADAFFGAVGERPLQRKVRQTLANLGVKVPRTGASVPAHLARLGITTREGEILRLVNAGLSNADIAQQLYISVRTVETHVSSMLQKTGSESRDQLPRW